MTPPPRPTGISILAIIFALWVFQGIGRFIPENAALFDGLVGAFKTQPLRQAIGLAFLLVSILSAYGLWQMRRWALWSYSLAAMLFVAGGLAKDIHLKTSGESQSGWAGIILPWVIVAVVWFLIGLYLNRALPGKKPNKLAPPNGGPAASVDNSNARCGPPSVS